MGCCDCSSSQRPFHCLSPCNGDYAKARIGGSILGITSGAFTASTAQPNYSAAKGGIVSLTRSAAMTAASISLRGVLQ